MVNPLDPKSLNDCAENQSDSISRLNFERWSKKGAVDAYRKWTDLYAPEQVIFDKLRDNLRGWDVLDIGVGGGRTTHHLHDRCGSYIGIDYSFEMVKQVRSRFKNCDLRQEDARNLSKFKTNSFDLVIFSFNGIDYVGHEDRVSIFFEIQRVLKPGGHFVFSSHNRDFSGVAQFGWRSYLSTDSVRIFAKKVLNLIPSILDHYRLKDYETQEDEYALINDDDSCFITYYISPTAQISQLERLGFGKTEAYSLDGSLCHQHVPRDDDWMIYYVTQKID